LALKTQVRSALSKSCNFYIELGWFINSGNVIITSKLNKRFFLLSAFNIGIFVCCEKAAEWTIEDENCYIGILYIEIPVTKFAFTGM
jgi:hypothetical protein